MTWSWQELLLLNTRFFAFFGYFLECSSWGKPSDLVILPSGPNEDHISFHIHAAGDWTQALYKRCEDTLIKEKGPAYLLNGGKVTDTSSVKRQDSYILTKKLIVRVDGPFGAPAQDHSRFTCLLLVVRSAQVLAWVLKLHAVYWWGLMVLQAIVGLILYCCQECLFAKKLLTLLKRFSQ